MKSSAPLQTATGTLKDARHPPELKSEPSNSRPRDEPPHTLISLLPKPQASPTKPASKKPSNQKHCNPSLGLLHNRPPPQVSTTPSLQPSPKFPNSNAALVNEASDFSCEAFHQNNMFSDHFKASARSQQGPIHQCRKPRRPLVLH